MLATILCIAREEGVAALWKGIIPGLHRQFLYGGLRIGLYEPVCTSPHSCPSLLFQFKGTSHNSKAKLPSLPLQVKAFFVGGTAVTDVSLLSKILAALTTGVIAIVVANPTDLVKVRLQADGKANTVKRNYSGALNAYATIIRQEGIGALWTGLGPNVARNAIINAAELASYDQFKQLDLVLGFLLFALALQWMW